MEQEIDIFEEIRSYILGKMTSEEAVAFEEKMAKDENLRREYENIREVGHAVTKMHSIEAIRESIEKNAQTEPAVNPNLEEDLEELERELAILEGRAEQEKRVSFWDKIVAWFTPEGSSTGDGTIAFPYSYVSRLAVSLAVAASVALAVFLPVNRYNVGISGFNEASGLLTEVVSSNAGLSRGDTEMGSKIEAVNDLIRENKTKEALDAVVELEDTLQKKMKEEGVDVLQRAEMEEFRQEVEWYKAVLLMKEKKVYKAKSAFKTIAMSGGKYADAAKKVLEKVY